MLHLDVRFALDFSCFLVLISPSASRTHDHRDNIYVVREGFRSPLDVRVCARAACEAGYENPEPKLLARIPSNRRPFLRSR